MLLRMVAIAAMLALAMPTLAVAEGNNQHHPGGGKPPGGAKPPGGGGANQFTWHGRAFNRVHLAPFAYPSGWAYRRWAVGAILPPLFLAPAYYYGDWATLGLDPPMPGFQWVRYGPDLLLVNITTGEV